MPHDDLPPSTVLAVLAIERRPRRQPHARKTRATATATSPAQPPGDASDPSHPGKSATANVTRRTRGCVPFSRSRFTLRVAPTPARDSTGTRSAVYLLQHRTEARFKLGWSFNPWQRLTALPEYREQMLDLAASRVVWLPDRQRTEVVERSMHRLLRPFRVFPRHRDDGHSEWFDEAAWPCAIDLLSHVPWDDDPSRRVRLYAMQGLLTEGQQPELCGLPARDTWLRLEDLLRRIARRLPMSLDVSGESARGPRLRVSGLRSCWNDTRIELRELRASLIDAETWQYRSDGRPHAFVQWVSYDGEDLLVQFNPLRVMESWDSELNLAWHIAALIERLVKRPNVPSAALNRQA